ncbi:hypothetical protein Bca4012_023271 [Brassica carinata]
MSRSTHPHTSHHKSQPAVLPSSSPFYSCSRFQELYHLISEFLISLYRVCKKRTQQLKCWLGVWFSISRDNLGFLVAPPPESHLSFL